MAADKVQGVPEGVTLEPVQPQVEGLPEGVTLEPVSAAPLGETTPYVEPPKKGMMDTANEYYNRVAPEEGALGRIGQGLGRFAMMAPNLVRGAYHAATDEYTPEEQGLASSAGAGTIAGNNPLTGRVAVAAKRMIVDPSLQAMQHIDDMARAQEKRAAAAGKPFRDVHIPGATEYMGDFNPSEPSARAKVSEKAGKAIAAIPFIGPMALESGERAARGDVAGAMTDVATQSALPEVIHEAMPGGALPGAARAGESAFPVAESAVNKGVRGAAKTYNAALNNPRVSGAMIGGLGGALTGNGINAGEGAMMGSLMTPGLERVPRAGENLTMRGIAPEDRAVVKLQGALDTAQKEFTEADNARSAYKASELSGEPIPEKIVKDYDKAEKNLAEAQKHLKLGQEEASRTKQGLPHNKPKTEAGALGSINTPEAKPAAETGEALGGPALKNPLGEQNTPAAQRSSESGEALANVKPANSGALGEIGETKAKPAAVTGEALGQIPLPEREITPAEVKSSPGTSMSPEGKATTERSPSEERDATLNQKEMEGKNAKAKAMKENAAKKAAEKETPSNFVTEGANDYNKENGREPIKHEKVETDARAKEIADEYENMKHDPNDPAVKKSYDALKQDVDKQWKYATDKMGIKLEPWNKEGQPYANSKEMMNDVKNNKHLSFFQGGDIPADHPLAAVDPETGLSYNDKFRAVHDLFGHTAGEHAFGPKGEERAFLAHSQMMSPEAVPAMATETRGQNSWVNFGKHLRNEAGEIPAKGENGFIEPAERPFAEQKAGVMSDQSTRRSEAGTGPEGEERRGTAEDRRQSPELRKRVSEMSPEEMKKALLTDPLTGLPNKRAFEEGQSKAVAMSDADALKAFNDKFNYAAGDSLLKAKVESLKEVGVDAYRDKGDEFFYRGESQEDLKTKLDKAREILRNREIEVTMNDGTTKTFKGADFSYGTGEDTAGAEAGLKSHKAEREARGERARGELRGITETGTKPGEVGAGAAEEGVKQAAKPEEVLNHIKEGKPYSILQAENPDNTRISDAENAERNAKLKNDLEDMGYKPMDVTGHTKDVEGGTEHAFFVQDIKPEDAQALGKKYGQAAILTNEGLHDLKTGDLQKADNAKMLTGDEAKKQDYYTSVGDQHFSVPLEEAKNTATPKGPVEGYMESLPAAQEHVNKLSNANLKELAKQYGLNPDEYDFSRREALREGGSKHPVERIQMVKDLMDVLPEERVVELARAAEKLPDEETFKDVDKSSQGKAEMAEKMFPELRKSKSLKAQGPGPEATADTAKMSDEELLKHGFTKEDIENGRHLPGAKGGSEAEYEGEIPEEANQYLADRERAGLKTSKSRQTFTENLEKLPDVQEFVDIALKGEGGRKWYQRGTQAFDALEKEAPRYFQEGDRDKFIDFLASTSPQQSVKMNLGETLNAWTKYVDMDRPKGAKLEKLLRGNLTLADSKVPNAMKALAGEPLWPDLSKNAQFKVPSFADNLKGYLGSVTNDGWQALFGGMDAKQISKPSSYHPLAVVTRAAADALGWEPAEAQAAIWAFTKTFTEHGEDSPEIARQYSQDFADIMAHDPEIRSQLKELGVDLGQLDTRLKAIGEKPEVSGRTTPTTEDSVRKLASRIEGAGRELPQSKDQGSLNFKAEDKGDTSFNTEELGKTETGPFTPKEVKKLTGDRSTVAVSPEGDIHAVEGYDSRSEVPSHVDLVRKAKLGKDLTAFLNKGGVRGYTTGPEEAGIEIHAGHPEAIKNALNLVDTLGREETTFDITNPKDHSNLLSVKGSYEKIRKAVKDWEETNGAKKGTNKSSLKNPEVLKEASKDETATLLVMPDGTVHHGGPYDPSSEQYTHSSVFNDMLANHDEYSPSKGEAYTELEDVDWNKFMEDGGVRAAIENKNSAFTEIQENSPETVERALAVLDKLGKKKSNFEYNPLEEEDYQKWAAYNVAQPNGKKLNYKEWSEKHSENSPSFRVTGTPEHVRAEVKKWQRGHTAGHAPGFDPSFLGGKEE